MKSSHAYILAVLILIPLIASGQSVSKTGTVAATFLEIPVGARAIAMGSAFVSTANDPSGLYWNPAGTALLRQNAIAATHSAWIADTRFDYAALVVPLSEFGTLGLSFTALSMDDMKVRTVELPEGTGEYFSANDFAVGLSYSRRLSDRFAVGFTAKYIQQNIWHESANAFALDIGTTFRTDILGGLVIGASLLNFGTSMKLEGRDMREFGRVDDTKLGSNDKVPSNLEMESWGLPLLFQFGIAFDPVRVEDYRWTVEVDAVHPGDNYGSINAGTEVSYRDFLFLRGGYHSLFLSESEGGLSLGFGISSSILFSAMTIVNLDYAYRDMGRLEAVQTITLGVRF